MFSEQFKALRKEKGATQEDLAKLLNITQTQVSYYEKGKALPPFHALIALADYFAVSIDYLVGRSDDPRSNEFDAKNRERRSALKIKETKILDSLPVELLPAYQAAREKNPENLSQIIETFTKMAEDYHSLTKRVCNEG